MLFRLHVTALALRVLECVECLIGVSNEWQAHLRILVGRHELGMCSVHGAVVLLWDFIDREVADIDIGRQLRFEWCSDLPQLIPNDASEEWVFLDGRCPVVSTSFLAQTIGSVTKEAGLISINLIDLELAYLRIISSASRPKTNSSGK